MADPNHSEGELDVNERALAYDADPQDDTHGFASPQIERAWIDEAQRRSRMLRDGQMRSHDASEVLDEIRDNILN